MSAEAGTLDEAWKAAEAALPKDDAGKSFDSSGGVWLSLGRINGRTYRAEWGATYKDADTPAAALLALAAALRGVPA